MFLLAIDPVEGIGLTTDPDVAPHAQKALARFLKNVRRTALRITVIADLDYDQQRDNTQTFLRGLVPAEHWKAEDIEGHHWTRGDNHYLYIRDGAVVNPGRLWKLGGYIWAGKGTMPMLQDLKDGVRKSPSSYMQWKMTLPAKEHSYGDLSLAAYDYIYGDNREGGTDVTRYEQSP